MSTDKKAPEILAPVGTFAMAQAAVHNGADAIYVGTPYFNARGRTTDFTVSELKEIVDFCHLYSVKVFLACNVLIFERELGEIESILREVLPLGIDALIVQDIGLVRLIKRLAPWQVVHASTQMTVSNAEAIALTDDLDIARYVLAREVSMVEMERIRGATTKELEVFVHGALCVAYSGQCLTSESYGGRSANRGQCAQSCRLEYDLIVDGKKRELGAKRHLVSPQDLNGLDNVGRLIDIGIESFKIEGRLKQPEYVAAAVRNYREVADLHLSHKKESEKEKIKRQRELGLTFARGHFNGWLDGVNHQKLVDARFSRPSGNFLGEVVEVGEDTVAVRMQEELVPGDGIVFHNFESGKEQGGIVFSIRPSVPGVFKLRLGKEFSLDGIEKGMEVYHNSSSSLSKELRLSYTDKERFKKIPLAMTLSGAEGERLLLTVSDGENTAKVYSEQTLSPAKSAPLTRESALDELGALGGTAFILTDFEWNVKGSLFAHNKILKSLRREGIEKITITRTTPRSESFPENSVAQEMQVSERYPEHTSLMSQHLTVLIRDESQIPALRGVRADTVYLDYEFNKDYERSLSLVREMGFKCGIATTRILKPGERGHLTYLQRLKPDSLLVRNLGALYFFKDTEIPLIGDFSLNISNSLSAEWFMSKGLSRFCASYDLNKTQLLELIDHIPPSMCEVTVHQYMPAFHMEHCVYAAFLSNGTSYRDCGRPCEHHRVELRDREGVLHPLKPDAECRNTMFQGKPQAAARLIPELLAKGVGYLRVEALFETVEELRAKIEAYSAMVYDRADSTVVFKKVGLIERYGVTEGQLFNERVYENKKQNALSVLRE